MLQAYVDGELGHAERVILEQHVSECPACQGLLRRHQRTSAVLFEAFSDQQLGYDLTKPVRENLPEMEFGPVDVVDLNMRTKHPAPWRERALKLVPLAAAALLVVLGMIIRENWPQQTDMADALGVVTFANGTAMHMASDNPSASAAPVEHVVRAGDTFETSEDSQLMVSLAGPTDVRLNEQTRVQVFDPRRIRVERGEVLLDVGRDSRLFKVLTPNGAITVYGTSFDVQVARTSTRVVVETGKVMVEHGEFESEFRELKPGQETTVWERRRELQIDEVEDTKLITAWADDIVPDQKASETFERKIQLKHRPQFAGQSNWFDLPAPSYPRGSRLEYITLEWDGVPAGADVASYDVFVYRMGDDETPLFRGRINGDEVMRNKLDQVRIRNSGNPHAVVDRLWIRLEPDQSTGNRGLKFTNVYWNEAPGVESGD